MKKEIKVFFVALFLKGGLFAVLMGIWDYAQESTFPFKKFIFHFFFFGLIMGILSVYNHRKKVRNELSDKN
jgi:succinate-acetate transporter protein